MSAPAESELLPQNSNGDMRLTFGDNSLELRTEAEAQKYTVRGHIGRHPQIHVHRCFPQSLGVTSGGKGG